MLDIYFVFLYATTRMRPVLFVSVLWSVNNSSVIGFQFRELLSRQKLGSTFVATKVQELTTPEWGFTT